MNLVIDIGNTRGKYAFFDEKRLVEAKYGLDGLMDDVRKWKKGTAKLDVFLSGSGQIEGVLKNQLAGLSDGFWEASAELKLPLRIDYLTPETLGFDRIANCVGGMSLFPNTPLLVIDSGTAVTYNYVGADGVFLGGNISPGLEMRFRGLYQFTAKLPYVCPDENHEGFGRTTEQAIRNGVMNGIFFEVEGYIKRFINDEAKGRVVITGGNSHFLMDLQQSEVAFCEQLGFEGLNEILLFVKKYD
ncbi:MAG: type III pantothenate kinase [Odoribacter sp.]